LIKIKVWKDQIMEMRMNIEVTKDLKSIKC
jgi:hypothetical protein